MPPEVEREAVQLAEKSWPVSLALALYYTRAENASLADGMANQFARLAAEELDRGRLAHYRDDVESAIMRIARVCGPETSGRLVVVLAEQFPVEPHLSPLP